MVKHKRKKPIISDRLAPLIGEMLQPFSVFKTNHKIKTATPSHI